MLRILNPLSALHDSVGQAWLQYIQNWLEEQVRQRTISPEQASENSERAKQILFSQGLSLPDVTQAVLDTEPEAAFFSDANPSLLWSSYAPVQSIPPEINDTYTALDEYFGPADVRCLILFSYTHH